MTRIFISYRRDDSKEKAYIIYENLVTYFGKDNIFLDEADEKLPPGVQWKHEIYRQILLSDVMLGSVCKLKPEQD